MIRRKFAGNAETSPDRSSRLPARNKILLSRQEKRALRSLRLMEKVESLGLENIMHSSTNYHPVGISPLAISSVRSRNASPMTQLTSLKNISQNQRRSDDLYAVDKDTIRAVLNKGLSHESLLSDISTDGSTTSSITNRDSSSDSTLNSKKMPMPLSEHDSQRNSSNTAQTTTTQPDAKAATKTPQKLKSMQRQKSRRSLINGGGVQRPDLGTVGNAPIGTKSLSNNKTNKNYNNHSNSSSKCNTSRTLETSTNLTQQFESDDDDSVVSVPQSYTQSFVGSISSLFFGGRKGGLL